MNSQAKVIHMTDGEHILETHTSSSALQDLAITTREFAYHPTTHLWNTWNVEVL